MKMGQGTRNSSAALDAAYAVQLSGVRKQFGRVAAVEEFSLDIGRGEFISLLGPSGCGKTTTLRMVAGFLEPTRGSVFINGRLMNKVPPYARNCGMVFQNYALFPHLSAFENVAYGLRLRRTPGNEINRRVGEALDMVRMAGWGKQFPRQLSGGQQQRIALARALVIQPSVLLLDEPLSNLDAQLRVEMREEIRSLVKSVGITTIFVTHDQEESLTMADRIVVMSRGKVEQVGSAADLYERPETSFVATFVGITNLLKEVELLGSLGQSSYALRTRDGQRLEGRAASSQVLSTGRVALSIRPERIHIETSADVDEGRAASRANSLLGTIASRSYQGPIIRYRVSVSENLEFTVDQQNRDVVQFEVGDPAHLWWNARDALVVAFR